MHRSLVGILISTLVCASCGGGSKDSDKTNASGTTPPLPTSPAPDAKPRTGYFLNTKGVRYNACGYQGTTGDRGAFTYDSKTSKCTTAFFLGNMQLGDQINAVDDPIVTPYNLSQSVSQTDGSDVLTFLQSINARPNTQGVIEIPSSIDLTARDAGWSVDFGKETFGLKATRVLEAAGMRFADAAKAAADYAPSITCFHTGHQRGTWSGAKTITTYTTTGSSTSYFSSVGGGAEGVMTPDGSIWLNLLEDPYYRNHSTSDAGKPSLDYDVVSGQLAPHLRVTIKDDIKLDLYPDGSYDIRGKLSMPSLAEWSGFLTVTSPNRHSNWSFPAGDQWTRFYYDVPELRFAGREGKNVLGMDIYADGTVRVVVADTDANKTPSYHLGSALIQNKLDGDHVSGSAVVEPNGTADEPRTYAIDGGIDRTLRTFVGKVTVTTPSSGTQPFMEFTPEVPAMGCVLFPVIE